MLAYVLNQRGVALMPCKVQRARVLLKEKKARVIRRKPFTIQLLFPTGETKQPIVLGVDSGYHRIGLSAVSGRKEVFAAEVVLRNDIVKLNSERRQYRRFRRSRKTWYREPRFLNRKKDAGWLAPSIQHKLDTHIRVIENIKKILPITEIVVEVAAFDIQKINNPDIQGTGYQNGPQKGFWNVREYVLHRDGHICQNCKGKSKDKVLQVHHIVSRQIGSDRPDNLVTLCKTCHQKVSEGKITLDIKPQKDFKPETFITTVRWMLVDRLKELYPEISVKYTYGYLTKSKRIMFGLEKSHVNGAFAISGTSDAVRYKHFAIKQNRRNNRALQLNRKGSCPSIRKRRYLYQPGDLVKLGGTVCIVKGMFNYGKWIRIDSGDRILNTPVSKVSLFKYQRGLAYV
jgi:N6-L-threonylcarbamoyladenine synthase